MVRPELEVATHRLEIGLAGRVAHRGDGALARPPIAAPDVVVVDDRRPGRVRSAEVLSGRARERRDRVGQLRQEGLDRRKVVLEVAVDRLVVGVRRARSAA